MIRWLTMPTRVNVDIDLAYCDMHGQCPSCQQFAAAEGDVLIRFEEEEEWHCIPCAKKRLIETIGQLLK